MNDARPLDPAELLAHVNWVRRLARALVRDADAAEDLAQETLRVTLEQPSGRVGTGTTLRAWLQRVARRLALDRWRADSSRILRERAVAPREPTEGTFEVVARSARQQRVVAAVHELAEPYRSTILHRYLDELSTREVARRTDVSEELVRKRLERGLAQLRERLDRDFGCETRNWAVALLTLPGVVAVTVKTQIGIAAALVVGVAATLGGLALRGSGRAPGSHDAPAALAPAAAATAPALATPAADSPAGAVASRTPEPVGRPTPPRTGAGPLRVRVVDSQGRALTQGRLTFAWLDDEPFRDPARAHVRELPIDGETTDIEIPPQMRSGELTASVAGMPPSPRCGIGGALHSESVKEHTITIGASLADPKVTGRILVDGRPEVPRGLRIAIDGTTFSARVHLLDGRFEAGPITDSIASLFVTSDETVPRQFEFKAGARDVDLDLTRGRTLDLTVVDRATKEPLPGLELYVTVMTETKRESMFKTKWRDGSRFVVTDGAGVASVRGIPAVGIVMVRRDASIRSAEKSTIAGTQLRADQLREPLADFTVDADTSDPIEKTIEIDAVDRMRVVRGRLASKLFTGVADSEPKLEVHWVRVDAGERGRRPDGVGEIGDDGAFRFTVDTSGDYRIWAERGQLRVSDVASLKVESADPDSIELHARAGGEITLRLVNVPAKGFVHLYVEDPGAVYKQATVVPAAGADIERRIALDGPTWLMAGWYLERGAALGTSHRQEVDPATTSRVEIDLGGNRQRPVELSFTIGAPPPQSQVALLALDRKGETPVGVAFHGGASDAPVAIDPGRYLAVVFGAPGVVAGEVTIAAGPADMPIRLRLAVEEHRKRDLGAGFVVTKVGSVELDESMRKVCQLRFAERPDVVTGETVLLPAGATYAVLEK